MRKKRRGFRKISCDEPIMCVSHQGPESVRPDHPGRPQEIQRFGHVCLQQRRRLRGSPGQGQCSRQNWYPQRENVILTSDSGVLGLCFHRRAADSSTTTPSPGWLSRPASRLSCWPDTATRY